MVLYKFRIIIIIIIIIIFIIIIIIIIIIINDISAGSVNGLSWLKIPLFELSFLWKYV